MNIAFLEAEEGDTEKLRKAFPTASLTTIPQPLSAETVAAAQNADVVSVFVKSHVTKDVLEELPNVKLITTRSTGFDHINMETCQVRNILVANVPTYGENTVAEHAFALILALSRKIFQSYERTERMNFDRTGLQGFDLFGRTLGVVGTGHIGRHVLRIGRGFSMNLLAYDARPDQHAAAELGFAYVQSLEELLSRSDVLTLHAPYLPATHHMINMENVKKIKPGALLVNTARGALVDTEALLWALNEKILSGAGLDVLEEEDDMYEEAAFFRSDIHSNEKMATILRNHILVARPDVLITPHNAFNSAEAVQRIFDTTVANIRGFADGMPKNIVSPRGKTQL